MIAPAALAADRPLEPGARAFDRARAVRVGTRRRLRPLQDLPVATLAHVQGDGEEPRRRRADRAATAGEIRIRGQVGEPELDGLADGRVADALEAPVDRGAIADRVVAREALEARTRADVPSDRRQRLIVAAAAHAILAAAAFIDRLAEPTLGRRKGGECRVVRARAGDDPAREAVGAEPQGRQTFAGEPRRLGRDRLLTAEWIRVHGHRRQRDVDERHEGETVKGETGPHGVAIEPPLAACSHPARGSTYQPHDLTSRRATSVLELRARRETGRGSGAAGNQGKGGEPVVLDT